MNDKTHISDLTIAEFQELIRTTVADTFSLQPHYVYGIEGIMDLFHCSRSTAGRIKKGTIKKAVRQEGRTIATNATLALQLYGGPGSSRRNTL